MPKNYRELRHLIRGNEVIHNGSRTRCVYVFHRNSSGVGMAESPTSVTVAFDNGLVLTADEWTNKVHVLEQSFREVSPDF